jgi:hypothetical protein
VGLGGSSEPRGRGRGVLTRVPYSMGSGRGYGGRGLAGCARAWGADTWPERVLEPTQIVEYGGVEIPDGAPPRALPEAP